jgi:poly(A) polymerase
MELFNLMPCKIIKELKNAQKDAILDGVIPNEHDAALQFVKEKYAKIADKYQPPFILKKT